MIIRDLMEKLERLTQKHPEALDMIIVVDDPEELFAETYSVEEEQ